MFFLIYASKSLANETRWSIMKLFMIGKKKVVNMPKALKYAICSGPYFPSIRNKYGNYIDNLGIKYEHRKM